MGLRMSRPIKFRTWDTHHKEMLYDVMVVGDDCYVRDDELDFVLVSPYKQEVMQFTGLTDKNGKEIYEGDIIQYGNDTGRVEYQKKWASFQVISKGQNTPLQAFNGGNARLAEIVGNINENPELLNGVEL